MISHIGHPIAATIIPRCQPSTTAIAQQKPIVAAGRQPLVRANSVTAAAATSPPPKPASPSTNPACQPLKSKLPHAGTLRTSDQISGSTSPATIIGKNNVAGTWMPALRSKTAPNKDVTSANYLKYMHQT